MSTVIWEASSLIGSMAAFKLIWPYMPPGFADIALLLLAWLIYRFYRLISVLYRWWMWNHPSNIESASKLYHRKGLLIGYGFRMTARHTRELLLEIRKRGSLPLDKSEVGGSPALHAVGGVRQRPVRVPWTELVGHVGISGGTRVGKTRLLELMVSSLIQSPDDGPIIVIDPKGDIQLWRRLEEEARKAGRPFYSIRAADVEGSHRLNPLQTALTASEVSARIEVMFPGAGRSSVPIFTDYPVALVEAVAAAQKALGMWWSLERLAPPLLQFNLLRVLLAQYLQMVYGVGDGTRGGLASVLNSGIDNLMSQDSTLLTLGSVVASEAQSMKLLNALTPALRGLQTPPFGPIFASHKTTMDWATVEAQSGVAYVGLNNLLYRSRADSISRLVLSDVVGYVAQRYTQNEISGRPINLVIDELASAAYPHLVDALAQAGGANLRIIAAMQSEADLYEPMGGEAGATRFISNMNTQIYMRINHPKTRLNVSEGIGQVRVALPQKSGSVTHGGDDGARIRVDGKPDLENTPLIRPEYLSGLPKGQGYGIIQGQPYKLKVPLLPDLRTPEEVDLESRLRADYDKSEPCSDLSNEDSEGTDIVSGNDDWPDSGEPVSDTPIIDRSRSSNH